MKRLDDGLGYSGGNYAVRKRLEVGDTEFGLVGKSIYHEMGKEARKS